MGDRDFLACGFVRKAKGECAGQSFRFRPSPNGSGDLTATLADAPFPMELGESIYFLADGEGGGRIVFHLTVRETDEKGVVHLSRDADFASAARNRDMCDRINATTFHCVRERLHGLGVSGLIYFTGEGLTDARPAA